MSTTIAVKEDTMELLKMMKDETESETYDETIKKVIVKSKKIDVSGYFGMLKDVKKTFKRDKSDRLYK